MTITLHEKTIDDLALLLKRLTFKDVRCRAEDEAQAFGKIEAAK